TTGKAAGLYKAKDLMEKIARAAHQCGDPGMQFDTTINRWHTSKASGRINASNPCSEYMFLDDTACNLSSLNLLQFLSPTGHFEVEAFRHAVDTMIVAQEILVDRASYPTEKIGMNSHNYRPLGLGYANLGALLMACGLPYDSEAGRDYAGAVTALMHGQAYLTSSRLAAAVGPFPHYAQNREPMLEVIAMHRASLDRIDPRNLSNADLYETAKKVWKDCYDQGIQHGYRNSQVTVLAPTGTIAFMMDCDTTGVEPDIALVKYKKLVGGGLLKIVNNTVGMALNRLGYDAQSIESILAWIDEKETIEAAPELAEEHLPIFDCAFRAPNGQRSIHWMGHIRMMGAVQPFLSGAISKTVNLPHDATSADIEETYAEGWRLGLKALAVYRDGSKRTQPLNAGKDGPQAEALRPVRRKLEDERAALTHKFSIAGHEGYLTVGLYTDGQPGEIFLRMAKEGSTVSGLMDTIATMTSISLQYGVPLEALVNKFSHTRFEPSGFTNNPEIPIAKSVMDYVFRYLGNRYLKSVPEADDEGEAAAYGLAAPVTPGLSDPLRVAVAGGSGESLSGPAYVMVNQADAPSCSDCGSIMIRNGSCYNCPNCGSTSGCS
ncbi:MAG: vitamin B12-dependent ribonucleotide reductase, partial [Myxococcales bacterium]|nr:vitamin B12-dependent ribonucleotide reductase [Myxococcales bacterium]